MNEERRRVAFRIHPDTYERVKYWAARGEVSVNEWMADAVEGAISRANGDYDLPTLEIARLNQIVDEVAALSQNVASLEAVLTSVGGSILGLAKGDNYLMDESEDGELPVSGGI